MDRLSGLEKVKCAWKRIRILTYASTVKAIYIYIYIYIYILELGGMTKNVYHGIFLNYTGFTVYDGIFFPHG